MSYLVRLSVGDPREDRTIDTANKILDSGVLQLIKRDDSSSSNWEIEAEFSPSTWASVEGTPFHGPTQQMKGDGIIKDGRYFS